jgi:monomeric isocitrate dehydrogenase
MLSIVPLMNGGGLFETGAGGSAPNTWSNLSQKAALGFWRILSSWSIIRAFRTNQNPKETMVLAETLDVATE